MTTHETFLKEVAGRTGEVFSPVLKALLNLPKEELDYWVGQKGELSRRLGVILKPNWQDAAAISLPTSPFFIKEEVESDRVYPEGYFHRPVCEQLVLLSKHFTKLDASEILTCSKDMLPLPPYAEHGFAMPKWQRVGKTYNEAVEFVMEKLAASRQFKNERADQLSEKYLRLSERTEEGLAVLGNAYKSDYIILPAQFGFMHRGRSIRKVCTIYLRHEFGLGPYETGVMLLSHPERLQGKPNELYIDCPGAEYAPGADGQFVDAPYFHWYGSVLRFYTYWFDDPSSLYGSGSGLLPQ